MPSVGVEWINNYDWLNQLTHEHEDAGGFYDELVQNAGWIGSFNWGDANAWEDDFKRADKGGHASDWVDAVDFCYFTGHGSPWGFYFRSDVPDDSTVESDQSSGMAQNGDLRLGKNNLEWLALEVCNTLQWEAESGDTQYNVFDRWRAAFEGMHIMCSFTTTSLDLATPGRYFAAFLDGRWPSVLFGLPESLFARAPLKVIDAWFEMTSVTQPDWAEAAVLYAGNASADPANDYIHGCGDVAPDPYPHTFRVWIPHTC